MQTVYETTAGQKPNDSRVPRHMALPPQRKTRAYRRKTKGVIVLVTAILLLLVAALVGAGIYLNPQNRTDRMVKGFFNDAQEGNLEEVLSCFCEPYREEMQQRLPFIVEEYYKGDKAGAGRELSREWLQKNCLKGEEVSLLNVQKIRLQKTALQKNGTKALFKATVRVMYTDGKSAEFSAEFPMVLEKNTWLFDTGSTK